MNFAQKIREYNEFCGWGLELFAKHNPTCAKMADNDPDSEAGELRYMGLNGLMNVYLFFRANNNEDADAKALVEELAPKIIGSEA